MIDVIVYRPSSYEFVFTHDKLLGYALGFITLSIITWAQMIYWGKRRWRSATRVRAYAASQLT